MKTTTTPTPAQGGGPRLLSRLAQAYALASHEVMERLAPVESPFSASTPGLPPVESPLPAPPAPPMETTFHGGDLDALSEPVVSFSITPTLASAPRVGTLIERLRTSCGELGLKATVTIHF